MAIIIHSTWSILVGIEDGGSTQSSENQKAEFEALEVLKVHNVDPGVQGPAAAR